MSQSETAPVPLETPAYRVAFEQPRTTKYAVTIFVLNEGEKIRKQLRAMAPLAKQVDLIVADGGSKDGALDEALLKECGVKALLVKEGPGGLSAQMRMAFVYALEQGYEGIISIDGNGKDGHEAIPTFAKLLDEGYDHIQGSRFIAGGHHKNTPLSRHLGVTLLHAPLISLASGFRYTDTTNGFRGYSRRLLLDPRVQPFRAIFSRYELHYYLAIRAAKLGLKIIETPVTRCYPDSGPIPTKISGFRGNLFILETLLRAVTHQYNP